MIINIMPMGPEPARDASFDELKQDIERQTWIGRSTLMETPGGGNADGDSDTDAIEGLHKHGNRIEGPKGWIDRG
jgi:hypothetical protein